MNLPFLRKKEENQPISDDEYIRKQIRRELMEKNLIISEVTYNDFISRRLSIIGWKMNTNEFYTASLIIGALSGVLGYFYFEMIYIGIMFFLMGLTNLFLFTWFLESRLTRKMNGSLKNFIDRLRQNVATSKNALDLFDRTVEQLDQPYKDVIGDIVGRAKLGSVEFTDDLYATARHTGNKYFRILAALLLRQQQDGQSLSDVITMVSNIVKSSEKIASNGRKLRVSATFQTLFLTIGFFSMLFAFKYYAVSIYDQMFLNSLSAFLHRFSFLLVLIGVGMNIIFARR